MHLPPPHVYIALADASRTAWPAHGACMYLYYSAGRLCAAAAGELVSDDPNVPWADEIEQKVFVSPALGEWKSHSAAWHHLTVAGGF